MGLKDQPVKEKEQYDVSITSEILLMLVEISTREGVRRCMNIQRLTRDCRKVRMKEKEKLTLIEKLMVIKKIALPWLFSL